MNMNMNTAAITNTITRYSAINNAISVPKPYHAARRSDVKKDASYMLSSRFPGSPEDLNDRFDRVIVLGSKVAPRTNYNAWFFLAPRETPASHKSAFSLLCKVGSTILNYVFSTAVYTNYGCGHDKQEGEFNHPDVSFDSDDIMPVFFIDNYEEDLPKAYRFYDPDLKIDNVHTYWLYHYHGGRPIRPFGEERKFKGPHGMCISFNYNDVCCFPYSFCGLTMWSNTRIDSGHFYKQTERSHDPEFTYVFESKTYKERTLVLNFSSDIDLEQCQIHGFDAWTTIQDLRKEDRYLGWSNDEYERVAASFDGLWRTFHVFYTVRWIKDGYGNEYIRGPKSGSLSAVLRLMVSCLPPGMDVNKFMHYIHGNIYTDLVSITDMHALDTCRGLGQQLLHDAEHQPRIDEIARRYPGINLDDVPPFDYFYDHLDEFLTPNTIYCYQHFYDANKVDILADVYPDGVEGIPDEEQDQTIFGVFAHNYINVKPRDHHYVWVATRGFNYRNRGNYRRVAGAIDLVRPRRQDLAAGEDPVEGDADLDGDGEPVVVAPAPERVRERDAMYRVCEGKVYEILNTEFQPAGEGHKFTVGELRSLLDLEKNRGDIQGKEAGLLICLSNLLDKYNDGSLDSVYFSSEYLTTNPAVRDEVDKLIEKIDAKYKKMAEKMAKQRALTKAIPFGDTIRSNFSGDDKVFDENVRNGIVNIEVHILDQGMLVKDTDLAEDLRPVLSRNTPSPDKDGIRIHSLCVEKYAYVKPWWIPQFLITFICFLFNIGMKSFYFKYKDDVRMLYVNERLYQNTIDSVRNVDLAGPDLYAEVINVHKAGTKFYYMDPELPSMGPDTLLMALMQIGLTDGFFQVVQSQQIGLNTVLMDMVLKTPYFQPKCLESAQRIVPFHLSPALILSSFLALFLYVPPLSACVYQLPLLLCQKIMKLVSDIEWPVVILNPMIYFSILYVISLLTSVVVILNLYNHVILCHSMLGLTQLLTTILVKNSLEMYGLPICIIVLLVLTVINYPVLSHLSRMNPTQPTRFQERSILEVILLNVFMVLCLSLLKMLYFGFLSSLSTSQSESVLTMLKNIWKMKDLSYVNQISLLSSRISNLGSWSQLNFLSFVTYLAILLITMVLIYQMIPSLMHVSIQLRVPIKFILVILVIMSGASACQVKCSQVSQMDYRTSLSCISSFHGWEDTKSKQSVKEMMDYIPSSYVKDMEKICSTVNSLHNSPLMLNSVYENQLKLVLSVDSIIRYLPAVNSKTGLLQYLKSSGTIHTLVRILKDQETYCSPSSSHCLLRPQHVQLLQSVAWMGFLNCTQYTEEVRSLWMVNYEDGISIMMNYTNNYMKILKIPLMMKYKATMEFMTLSLVDLASGVTFVSKEFDMISVKLNGWNMETCFKYLQNNKDSLKITSPSFIETMNGFMNSFINATTVYSTLSNATLIEFPLVLAHHTGVLLKDYSTMLQQHSVLKTSFKLDKIVDSFAFDFDTVLEHIDRCPHGEDINNATLAECYYNVTRDYFKTKDMHVNPYTVFIFETSYAYFHLSKYVDKYSYFALFDPRLIYMVVGRVLPSVGRLVASLKYEREDFAKDMIKVGQLAVDGTAKQVSDYIDSVGVTTFIHQWISLSINDFVTSNFYFGYFEKDYANRIVSYYYQSHGMIVSVDYKISFDYNAFFGAWHVLSHSVGKVLHLPSSVNEAIHKLLSARDSFIDRYVF